MLIGCQGGYPPVKGIIDISQVPGIPVQHNHPASHPNGYPCRISADSPGAEDGNFAWSYPRHTADQYPGTPLTFLKMVSPHDGRHTPRNLAHRDEDRECAILQLDRLIGDGRDAAFNKSIRKRPV